jgi:hypothetical protein
MVDSYNNKVSQIPSMLMARVGHSAIVYNRKIEVAKPRSDKRLYVFGGNNSDTQYASIIEYYDCNVGNKAHINEFKKIPFKNDMFIMGYSNACLIKIYDGKGSVENDSILILGGNDGNDCVSCNF